MKGIIHWYLWAIIFAHLCLSMVLLSWLVFACTANSFVSIALMLGRGNNLRVAKWYVMHIFVMLLAQVSIQRVKGGGVSARLWSVWCLVVYFLLLTCLKALGSCAAKARPLQRQSSVMFFCFCGMYPVGSYTYNINNKIHEFIVGLPFVNSPCKVLF